MCTCGDGAGWALHQGIGLHMTCMVDCRECRPRCVWFQDYVIIIIIILLAAILELITLMFICCKHLYLFDTLPHLSLCVHRPYILIMWYDISYTPTVLSVYHKVVCQNIEYIVHGSKNENDSNFKLTLERVCWNDEWRFDLLDQDLQKQVETSLTVSTNSLQSKFGGALEC